MTPLFIYSLLAYLAFCTACFPFCNLTGPEDSCQLTGPVDPNPATGGDWLFGQTVSLRRENQVILSQSSQNTELNSLCLRSIPEGLIFRLLADVAPIRFGIFCQDRERILECAQFWLHWQSFRVKTSIGAATPPPQMSLVRGLSQHQKRTI